MARPCKEQLLILRHLVPHSSLLTFEVPIRDAFLISLGRDSFYEAHCSQIHERGPPPKKKPELSSGGQAPHSTGFPR